MIVPVGRPLAILVVLALSLAAPGLASAATLFVVTNTNDSGAGSLRQAITNANLAVGADGIEFAIPGSGIKVIEPLTPLPTIAEPVEIYGYTQTGAVRNTTGRGTNAKLKVVLSGVNLTSGTAAGLTISAPDSLVEGLVINRFRGAQIQLESGASSTSIRGTFLGVNAAGTSAAVNPAGGGEGIAIASDDNLIGGSARGRRNLISGNAGDGIELGPGSSGTVIRGNLIGTDRSGNGDIGNGFSGVQIVGSTDNTVGGLTVASRNVISGNGVAGVDIQNVGTNGNRILGSYLGVGADGRTALPNERFGVLVVGGSFNVVGNTAAGGRNVISGNGELGVHLGGSSNSLHSNYIGTDSTGRRDVGNGEGGVFAIGNDLLVGGPSAAHRNVISGNDGDGVEVAHTGGAEGVQVVGNFIGTDATGTRALGNSGDGVEPISGSNIWIGRPASRPGVAPGNVISGNRGNGIHVPTNLSASAVDGNLVGTNARGIAAVPNRLNGLAIFDGTNATLAGAEGPNVFSGNGRAGILITGTTNNAVVYDSLIGTNRAGTEAVPNRVGIEIRGSGSHSIGDPGAGNVISGNRGAGVSIRGLTSAIVLIGNRIGLAEATARPVPNGKGVVIAGPAAPNYIGFAGEPPNTIAGNRGPAIVLAQGAGGAPQGTQIAANRIGVTGSGKARPNRGPGILIDGATETTVGGNDPAAGNTIARNRGAGVAVRSGTGNLIRANSLFGNGGIGIDLGPSGATPNDPDDPDGGANRRQNSPVITSVSFASGVTTIEGHLNSVPSEAFVLDFYKTRSARAGAAEGRTHLGSANAATDAGGDVTFSFEVAGRVAGVWLRATATRTITGDTSELGRARRAP